MKLKENLFLLKKTNRKALANLNNTKIVQINKQKILKLLINSVFKDLSSDLDWIQTSNLLSRNQVRYSVAPRGLNAGANISNLISFASQF